MTERLKMDGKLLQKLGDQIAERVTKSDWYRDSIYIHCFAGSLEKGEIATTALLLHIIASGKHLVMPRITDSPGLMSHHRVTSPDSLVVGSLGIPEPSGGDTVEPGLLDLVLVPGLAADLSGNRIGYGKGYYDRFLASTPARSMMLVPECMILDRIPAMEHDIPVQALATEQKILYCGGNKQSNIA